MAEIRTPSVDGSTKPRVRTRSAKAAEAAPTPQKDGAASRDAAKSGPGQSKNLNPPQAQPSRDEDASVRILSLTAVDRNALISMTAYFRAEQRNFQAGQELEDWLAAEAEVDAQLLAASPGRRSA